MRIDQTNYESFFLSYIDGELDDTERLAVESYCEANPEAAMELSLLKQTVLVPTPTMFGQKDSLYRKEDDRRSIGWYVWRAAVLVVLLGGGGFIYRAMHPESEGSPESEKMAVITARKDSAEKKGAGSSLQQTIVIDSVTTAAGKSARAIDAGGPAVIHKQKHQNSAASVYAFNGLRAAGKSNIENASAGETRGEKASARSKAVGTLREKPSSKKDVYNGNRQPQSDPTAERGGKHIADPDNSTGPVNAGDLPNGSFPGRAKQTGLSTVNASSAPTGNLLPVTRNTDISGLRAADPKTISADNQVAYTDRAAQNEPGSPTGDDAVSIVHLARNVSPVRKLFHRITAGRTTDDRPESNGNKKVNISIFQFALGK